MNKYKKINSSVVLTALLTFSITSFFWGTINQWQNDRLNSDSISSTTTIETKDFFIKTYHDGLFEFYLDYPCDKECLNNPPDVYKNAYLHNNVALPTVEKDVYVSLGVFSQTSIDNWEYDVSHPEKWQEQGEAAHFNYSLKDLAKAMTNATSIPYSGGINYELKYKNGEKSGVKGLIIDINGHKAFQTYVTAPGSMSNMFRTTYVQLKNNNWIEINEMFSPNDNDFTPFCNLIDKSQKLERYLKASGDVVNSLRFDD